MELVESGETSGSRAEQVVEASLKPLLDQGADTIVLGCTHYPFLSDTISRIASRLVPERKVTVIDPAPAVARHLADVMRQEGLLPCGDGPGTDLYSSGDGSLLNKLYKRII